MSATAADTLAPEDTARADFYAVIARLFAAPPDAGFLRALAQADELVAAHPDAALPRAWNDLCAAAAAMPAEAAQEEFDALFQGVGRPAVVPYASYYLAGFMMEKPLADLRSDLAALGLARAGGVSEPEDHIAALAEVMRHLIVHGASTADEREESQQRFFRRHLQPWYERFCQALEAAEGANFYRHAARFTGAFLDLENESFEIEV
ncbi:MAG: molecular chaperone TorD family protein [Pseudomonadota bacterium]|jgi:TorA maturation chaperone TorD